MGCNNVHVTCVKGYGGVGWGVGWGMGLITFM